MRLVGQAGLFKHDRDLDAIGSRQGIELEPVGMLGGPLLRDRKCRKIVHRKSLGRGALIVTGILTFRALALLEHSKNSIIAARVSAGTSGHPLAGRSDVSAETRRRISPLDT